MQVELGTLLFQLIAMTIPFCLFVGLVIAIVFLVKSRKEQQQTTQKLDQILAHLEQKSPRD